MKSTSMLCVLPMALCACSQPWSEIEGTMGGEDLVGAETVMFGGPFIVIMDKSRDCLDMAWATRHYTDGEPPASYDFVALQFAFEDPEVGEGRFSLAGDAPVVSKFLVQEGLAFSYENARDGTLVIDSVNSSWASGTFDVTFDQGELDGSFQAEYCANLKD